MVAVWRQAGKNSIGSVVVIASTSLSSKRNMRMRATSLRSSSESLSSVETMDVHYRFYSQNAAEFYSDLCPREIFQNFLARDKELASMQSQTLGFGVAWEFKPSRFEFLGK